jgi:hypothetical protein
MTLSDAQRILTSASVKFATGLSARELAHAERTFGFEFPADLQEFLALGLPASNGWVNWRSDDEHVIGDLLGRPLRGICFDIEHNDFWVQDWGTRPAKLAEAFAVAARVVAAAPILIPIYSHRYIPATPTSAGNPVFSVHQTDVVYYGTDLLDYLQNEFQSAFGRIGSSACMGTRRIPFWSQLAEGGFEPSPGV